MDYSKKEYAIIYDFINEPPRFVLAIIGLVVIIIGYVIIKYTMKEKESGKKDLFGILESSKKIIFGFILIVVGLIMIGFTTNLSEYFEVRKVYKNKKFSITEGYASSLQINQGKNSNRNFYLNGVYFEMISNKIGDYNCSYNDIGFYDIQDSTYLRISYFKKNEINLILKIEKVNSLSKRY